MKRESRWEASGVHIQEGSPHKYGFKRKKGTGKKKKVDRAVKKKKPREVLKYEVKILKAR